VRPGGSDAGTSHDRSLHARAHADDYTDSHAMLTPSPTRSPTRTPTRTHTPTRTPRRLRPHADSGPRADSSPDGGNGDLQRRGDDQRATCQTERLSGHWAMKDHHQGRHRFRPGFPRSLARQARSADSPRRPWLWKQRDLRVELSDNPVHPVAGHRFGTGDGWKSNASGKHLYATALVRLIPPRYSGSANGLSLLKFNDQRAVGKGIRFVAKAKNAFLPIPRVRYASAWFSARRRRPATLANAVRMFQPLNCGYNGSGTR